MNAGDRKTEKERWVAWSFKKIPPFAKEGMYCDQGKGTGAIRGFEGKPVEQRNHSSKGGLQKRGGREKISLGLRKVRTCYFDFSVVHGK